MIIHELFKAFNFLGSEWVLAVLASLSLLTVFVILSRAHELRRLRLQSQRFWREQAEGWFIDPKRMPARFEQLRETYPCLETETLSLLASNETGSTEESERLVTAFLDNRKLKLERQVGILGTIGSNAPFIGLLGTVLGIMRAFHDIASGGLSSGMEAIMGGIAEALVATTIGLLVAVPAVVFFNLLTKQINTLLKKAHNVSQLALVRAESRKE